MSYDMEMILDFVFCFVFFFSIFVVCLLGKFV